MPVRKSNAVWEGTLRAGQGTMKFGGGAYEGSYSAASRFESGTGTNPEELLAAAHAGCFSMAFSADLERAGFPPTSVATTASVHLDKLEAGFTITRVELDTEAVVAGIDEATFLQVAEGAKKGCPVSRLFQGAEITVKARLLS